MNLFLADVSSCSSFLNDLVVYNASLLAIPEFLKPFKFQWMLMQQKYSTTRKEALAQLIILQIN